MDTCHCQPNNYCFVARSTSHLLPITGVRDGKHFLTVTLVGPEDGTARNNPHADPAIAVARDYQSARPGAKLQLGNGRIPVLERKVGVQHGQKQG